MKTSMIQVTAVPYTFTIIFLSLTVNGAQDWIEVEIVVVLSIVMHGMRDSPAYMYVL